MSTAAAANDDDDDDATAAAAAESGLSGSSGRDLFVTLLFVKFFTAFFAFLV
jgi:hypothetical protein